MKFVGATLPLQTWLLFPGHHLIPHCCIISEPGDDNCIVAYIVQYQAVGEILCAMRMASPLHRILDKLESRNTRIVKVYDPYCRRSGWKQS